MKVLLLVSYNLPVRRMGSELTIDNSHFKLEGSCIEEFRWSAKLLSAGGVIWIAFA
jgi:hypothetical protein